MTRKKLPLMLAAITLSGLALYCQNAPSLGEIARRNRSNKNSQSPAAAPAVQPSSSAAATPSASPMNTAPLVTDLPDGSGAGFKREDPKMGILNLTFIDRYTESIGNLFDQGKFETLDSLTDTARSTKSRLPGGSWTLYVIYVQLSSLPNGRDSDAEWMAHIERLKSWVTQRPQSITARVALASAYLDYGWKARGEESADKVTEEGWRLFHERAGMAAQTLIDADSLPTKCPEWFHMLQAVAEAQERSKEEKAAIFERAVAFEPDYQYFYRAEARSLLPQWDGEYEGEIDAFATRMADRLGGKRGDMLYYQIAADVICVCKGEPKLQGMSWPRIKRGYADVDEVYSSSLVNINKVARLAGVAEDAELADQLFARIGDSWNHSIWQKKENFETVRNWARFVVLGRAADAAFKAANDNLRTPEGRNFAQQVTNTFSANYRSEITECRNSLGDASSASIDLAIQLSKDGGVENLFTSGPMPATACVAANIHTQRAKLPIPPSPSYWVKVSIEVLKQQLN